MSEHITFQAEHPDVKPSHTSDGKPCIDYCHPYAGIIELSPAEAIALGYALFSIGLTLKQSKG